MKIEKKGKAKGKAIIGIAMAVIMLASLVTMVPTTGAAATWYDASTKTIGYYTTPLTYNGLENVIIADPTGTPPTMATTTRVIIGQDLLIINPATGAGYANVEIKGDPTSAATAGQIFTADSGGKFDSEAMTVEGTYYIKPVGGTSVSTPVMCEGILAVTTPTMNLDLRVGGTSVSSITQGTLLQTHFVNNLDQYDMVTLKIIDPNGNQIKSTTTPPQKFSKINVQFIHDVYGVAGIDTTGWKIGTYTFQVKTAKTVAAGQGARGLVASSNEKTLTIRKSEITISAEKMTVVKEEVVRLTVMGVTGHVITITSSDWTNTLFPGGLNNNPAADTTATFVDTIDADGKRTYAVKFLDTGAYTIAVTDTTVVPRMTDTVDITVTEKGKVLVSITTDKVEYSPGEIMQTEIRIRNPAATTKNALFAWYLGVPKYDLWAEMAAMPVNLPAGYDQTFTVPIPVGNWGAESFCGCHIASLTDTTTRKVVSVDSAAWIYKPRVMAESKTTTEIAKEIKEIVVGVEL